jgi:hypothetical protein
MKLSPAGSEYPVGEARNIEENGEPHCPDCEIASYTWCGSASFCRKTDSICGISDN